MVVYYGLHNGVSQKEHLQYNGEDDKLSTC